jgi:uncharacterized membrane protein
MIARLVAKRAEASQLVRTRHRSLTALGPCPTASFHLSHHLVVCVRSFLPHRPVFSPLLVGRSVAPTQQMGSYARVVDPKALTVGGMCGIVGWREAKTVMRLYQGFPFRQQGSAFRSGRSVVAAALLLRGHTTPPFLVSARAGSSEARAVEQIGRSDQFRPERSRSVQLKADVCFALLKGRNVLG